MAARPIEGHMRSIIGNANVHPRDALAHRQFGAAVIRAAVCVTDRHGIATGIISGQAADRVGAICGSINDVGIVERPLISPPTEDLSIKASSPGLLSIGPAATEASASF